MTGGIMAKRGSPEWCAAISRGKHTSRERDPVAYQSQFGKMVATRKANGQFWLLRKGGNGKGPTEAQAKLHSCIGGEIEYILSFGWKIGSVPGWPCCYKIDIGFPLEKLAVEVDGESHRSPKGRAVDALKEQRLRSFGWTTLRFWNREILCDPEPAILQIRAFLGRAAILREAAKYD